MKKRKGAVLVFGILFMLIMFAVMGYLWEVGRMSIAKIKAQNAADASAMGAQAVLSNLRNIATTHYMVGDLFRRVAVTASNTQPPLFHALWMYSWYKKDVYVRDLPDEKAAKIVKAYHFFFHVQDFAVTRFLAAYDSKIFFRDFIKKEAKNDFKITRKMMRFVSTAIGFLNIHGLGDNMIEPGEIGWSVVKFGKFPGWAPGGLKVDYAAEVEGPGGGPIRSASDEKEMDKKLGRAYTEAYVILPPSNFLMRTFIVRNWGNIKAIKEPFSFLEKIPFIIKADAAAGPRMLEVDVGPPRSIPGIGRLRVEGNWYFPEIIPVIKVENSPISDQWPYH
jgi:hypothetical protein